MKDAGFYVSYGIAVWLMFSLLASSMKAGADNCGIDYPIDYAIHTNLFCPMEVSQ